MNNVDLRIKEEVQKQLALYTEKDDILSATIDYAIKSEKQDILNFCALEELPVELEHILVKRVIGNLLHFIVQIKGNEGVNIDSMGVKSISEGDISISYNTNLDRSKLIFDFINEAREYGKEELYSFRKLRW